MDVQRTRGVISLASRPENRRLEGAFHRYRVWEASVGVDNDQSWESRMEFIEWETTDRVSCGKIALKTIL